MGGLTETGRGVSRDGAAALALFTQAGEAFACDNLGWVLLEAGSRRATPPKR